MRCNYCNKKKCACGAEDFAKKDSALDARIALNALAFGGIDPKSDREALSREEVTEVLMSEAPESDMGIDVLYHIVWAIFGVTMWAIGVDNGVAHPGVIAIAVWMLGIYMAKGAINE